MQQTLRLKPRLDGVEQLEARRAILRVRSAREPCLWGIGVARHGADAGHRAGLVRADSSADWGVHDTKQANLSPPRKPPYTAPIPRP